MSAKSLLPFGWGLGGLSRRALESDPFVSLQREVNRLFDDLGRGLPSVGNDGALPKLEIKETDKDLVITAELPGVDEKDVEVTLNADMLTIKGEKKSETDEQRDNVHVSERSYGQFERTVALPYAADPASVLASFAKGVLTVTLPKPPAADSAAKKIEVKAAAE